ncbi:hypothetical protein K9M06_01000 [Candidatus Bipolaricaulota bacterium]|nr:hypothetical protein [Candidatus Bipolaricaulota bacterium]
MAKPHQAPSLTYQDLRESISRQEKSVDRSALEKYDQFQSG